MPPKFEFSKSETEVAAELVGADVLESFEGGGVRDFGQPLSCQFFSRLLFVEVNVGAGGGFQCSWRFW